MTKKQSTKTQKTCAPTQAPCACLFQEKKHVAEPMAKTKQLKTKTKVIVRFDCGFSNSLFIRGEGISSLGWDKGVAMKNISPAEWMWESDRPCSTIQFKVLLNDNHFELGENHSIAFGQEIEVTPKF